MLAPWLHATNYHTAPIKHSRGDDGSLNSDAEAGLSDESDESLGDTDRHCSGRLCEIAGDERSSHQSWESPESLSLSMSIHVNRTIQIYFPT